MKVDWTLLDPCATTANGTKLEKQPDGSYLASGVRSRRTDIYTLKAKPDLRGITGIQIEALADDKLPAHRSRHIIQWQFRADVGQD